MADIGPTVDSEPSIYERQERKTNTVHLAGQRAHHAAEAQHAAGLQPGESRHAQAPLPPVRMITETAEKPLKRAGSTEWF